MALVPGLKCTLSTVWELCGSLVWTPTGQGRVGEGKRAGRTQKSQAGVCRLCFPKCLCTDSSRDAHCFLLTIRQRWLGV